MALSFPPQMNVFVRDWLSSNNVVLNGRKESILIDSGYSRHATFTLALLQSRRGIGDRRLSMIVNTHCHSDHMGGNALLSKFYGCPVAVPEGEAPHLIAWDQKALLLDYADQVAERFAVDEVLRAGETYDWGDLEWKAVAAPGHAMAALCFFNEEHGILVSGDALWENGFGFVMPRSLDPDALPATRATLEALSKLPIRVVVPGHGDPFEDVDAALQRAFRRLDTFEADEDRLVRHALKVVLMFKLLDCRGLALDALPEYLDRVGLYHDFNARFLKLSPQDLAEALVHDLARSGAVRTHRGMLVPA